MGFIAHAQQINLRKYTIEDGLVNNDILNIYQDSRGFIWLCTRGGLSRYDGSRFTNFTPNNGLTNDMINDIAEIAPQEFIVAQNSGGPRLLKNDRMFPIPSGGNLIINKFYKSKDARLLAVTDYDGVVEWNKNKFRLLNPAYKHISKMAILNDSVWLLLKQEDFIQLMTTSLQPLSAPAAVFPTALFVDSGKRIWMGTIHGLRLLDPVINKGGRINLLPLPASFNLPILQEDYISDFLEDSRGNYWVGTINGLVKIDEKGKSKIYNRDNGLPVSRVNCIMEDRENNIWIGTVQGLVKIALNNELRTIAMNFDVSGNPIAAVLPITENRLRLFDGKNISGLELDKGRLINNRLLNLSGYQVYKTGQKELLIINDKKAMLFHASQEGYETINWPAMPFRAVINTHPHQYLAATDDTLYGIMNGKANEKLIIPFEGWIQCLAFDKRKILWAGSWNNGLYKISITNPHDSLHLKLVDTIIDRLPDKHIRALYADRENELWIGTRYKGLLRLVELPGGNYNIQHYGTSEGLSSDFVAVINRDNKGNIWAGTMQGLDKLVPSEDRYRIFNFSRVNKIFPNIFDIAFLDNDKFVATSYLAVIHGKDMQQDTLPPPPVYISKVSTGPADSSFALNTGLIRLSNNKAQIYFEFSAPQFINEDFTRFSYRLLGGNDTSWSMTGKSHSVYFASLRPGNYKFEVRAMGFNGQWGQPTVYSFIVNTPFWQKGWFIALVIASIGVLIYALYRYRVQQLIRLQKVRNRIATDLHDEIGANLTNISILSNLSKRNLPDPAKAENFLQRISEEVSSSSQALDDIIWSVDSNNDTLEETVSRMRRYAAELFDAANTSYELYLDPAFEQKKLAMEQRRDIYLLYKEAVNNISKHAGAKQVNIQITIEHNQLFMRIKDDGKGFDTTATSNRHGLKGMKERVKKWKGKISIESGTSIGTMIQVSIPVMP
jgi:ligand-binding sensor domain-containing protein/two-component sensor histidine kinase